MRFGIRRVICVWIEARLNSLVLRNIRRFSIPPFLRLCSPTPPGDPAAIPPSFDRIESRSHVQNGEAVIFGDFAAVVIIDDVADLNGGRVGERTECTMGWNCIALSHSIHSNKPLFHELWSERASERANERVAKYLPISYSFQILCLSISYSS